MIDDHGINATYINANRFTVSGNYSDTFVVGKNIKADCGDHGFKYGVVASSLWISASGGFTQVDLDSSESDSLTDNLKSVWYESIPHMSDGRPIVRSDTRPLGTETYFTDAGDSESNIGDGKEMRWDFSNDDDLYTGSEVPSGYKAKEIKMNFLCITYLKDGAVYFFDAPWGQYVNMDIVVPSGSYYPNPAGQIPAYMLGLSGNKMYAQATEDLVFRRYVNKHYVYGSCPMGDELNTEGCSTEGLPIGWYIRGLIITPESDNTSKGYASFEMYRCHTVFLPGVTELH